MLAFLIVSLCVYVSVPCCKLASYIFGYFKCPYYHVEIQQSLIIVIYCQSSQSTRKIIRVEISVEENSDTSVRQAEPNSVLYALRIRTRTRIWSRYHYRPTNPNNNVTFLLINDSSMCMCAISSFRFRLKTLTLKVTSIRVSILHRTFIAEL